MKGVALSGFILIVLAVLTALTLKFSNFEEIGITWLPDVIVAWGTIALAIATFQLGRTEIIEHRKDRKVLKLNEIRNWIFEIMAIMLKPISTADAPYLEENRLLRTSTAFTKAEYFLMTSAKIFGDQDLDTMLKLISEKLLAVMVLHAVVVSRKRLNEHNFEALLGYDEFKNKLLGAYESMLTQLKKDNPDGIEIKLVQEANQKLENEYTVDLNIYESKLLSKLTDMESNLL